MGLLQKAIETYDAMQAHVGVEEEGQESLAPASHILTRAQIEITIDAEGRFIQARPASEEKIIIPVTEDSASRSGKAVFPHPLCDQLGYLLLSDPKRCAYIEQLEDWVASPYTHPKAQAVLRYVKGGTMYEDLQRADLLSKDKGKVKNEGDLVRWIVLGLGKDDSGPVWKDVSLMQAFDAYYQQKRQEDSSARQNLCMLTGEQSVLADKHLKGVVALHGNAKIISANDSVNYTYRGRFIEASEAATLGYNASQKAHNALKWVASNQGQIFGTRCFVCWNPHGLEVPALDGPLVFQDEEEEELLPSDYAEQLRQVVLGYKQKLPEDEGVVMAAFDAATAGRLAVTYYNELAGSDFVDRLAAWDATCCWHDSIWGTYAPRLYDLVNYAFGTLRDIRVETDKPVMAQHMQRLIACRVNRSAFPADILRALVSKAGNMQVYAGKTRSRMLFTTCAAIKKYKYDHTKEEWTMALEPGKKDRSYQFGRLLAVLEKVERDTYDKGESRETNAIRLQSVFVRRPAYAFKLIEEQLNNAYYPRLKEGQRIYYRRLTGEILEQISECGLEDYEKPLTETYLLGYYLQKNVFYTKKENDNTEE